MRTISSRHNPVVAAFRALATTPDPAGRRVLLDGPHLIGEALDAGLDFEVILVAASRSASGTEAGRLAHELERRGLPIVEADDRAFDAVSPVRSPSGIAAIALRAPSAPALLCDRADAFVLVVADVQDPGNVGALLRSAEAGGVTGAFVTGASANPFSWKALRGSMGSALRLPTATGLAPEAIMAEMRQAGMRVIASVARGGADPDGVSWKGSVGLWIGGEGHGLADDLVERCDERVTIPMAPQVESLNAAVAGALLVYAARRQRT
ncbi:MAG TPA: RNA methyltransferase [Vicinamibacterales bacterium]|nr:RNA methyltransferase [Vicinamibacterales bacterium]